MAVASDAVSMCTGQVSALPNTHTAITATLIYESSSIILLAPPASLSVSTTSSFSSSSSITRLTTTTPSLTPAPTSLLTETSPLSRASGTTSTSSSSTPTAAPASADRATITPTLTKSQVVAITVSAVGGAALLLGLIVLVACIRRRRLRARDSNIFPFQSDPSSPSYAFKTPMQFQEESSSKKGAWSKLPSRSPTKTGFRTPMEIKRDISTRKKGLVPIVPPRIETSDPYMFARRSLQPDTIGLAMSPERTPIMDAVRTSRLLPEKPTLWTSTNTSQAVELPGNGQVFPQFRQSTATQFEEDDESMITPGDDKYRSMSEGMLGLAPAPEPARLQTIKVIPPDIAQPAYFNSSSNGSNDQQRYPDYYVKPLALGRGVGSFSRPLGGPTTQLQVPSRAAQSNSRPITAGSSVYSQASNTPYTADPFTLSFPMPPSQQPSSARRRSSKPNRGSETSFESSSAVSGGPRDTIMMDLSPVEESPSSPTGVSPVSYPKIKRLSQQLQPQKSIRMVPPPAQPDFASVFSSNAGQAKPWEVAERAAALARKMSKLAPPQQQTLPRTPEQQPQAVPKLQSPFQPRLQPPAPARLNTNPTRTAFMAAPSAHYNTSVRPSKGIVSQNYSLAPPPINPRSHLRKDSLTSLASQNSTSSSLLAKRLGADKAGTLKLVTGDANEERLLREKKWRVLREEEDAKRGWSERGNGGGGGWEDYDVLPTTPGWVPKLTPTRRGDELFLSVA